MKSLTNELERSYPGLVISENGDDGVLTKDGTEKSVGAVAEVGFVESTAETYPILTEIGRPPHIVAGVSRWPRRRPKWERTMIRHSVFTGRGYKEGAFYFNEVGGL